MVKYYKNIIVSKFNTMTKIEPDDFAGYLAAAESEDAAKNMDAVDRYILLFMLLFLQENIKCVTSFEKWIDYCKETMETLVSVKPMPEECTDIYLFEAALAFKTYGYLNGAEMNSFSCVAYETVKNAVDSIAVFTDGENLCVYILKKSMMVHEAEYMEADYRNVITAINEINDLEKRYEYVMEEYKKAISCFDENKAAGNDENTAETENV